MSKSLEFVKEKISSGQCNNMNISDYENATEYEFTNILNKYPEVKKLFKDNKIVFTVDGTDENGIKGKKKVTVAYDPNVKFEYFSSEFCTCDGTLMFMDELIDKLFRRVMTSNTINTSKMPDDYFDNIWNYDMEYTVGDFIINDEYGNFGTEEKPWLHSRFTVMLPIKCDFITR